MALAVRAALVVLEVLVALVVAVVGVVTPIGTQWVTRGRLVQVALWVTLVLLVFPVGPVMRAFPAVQERRDLVVQVPEVPQAWVLLRSIILALEALRRRL